MNFQVFMGSPGVFYLSDPAANCRSSITITANRAALHSAHSQIDGHDLLIYDYTDCVKEFRQPTRWHARSGKYAYAGIEGQKATLMRREQIPERMMKFFNVKGIGLGFLGDVRDGTKHTDLFEQMLQKPDQARMAKVDTGLLEFQRLKGYTIRFDPEKGLWPVSARTPFAEWEIRIDKI
jgi:hypothetical protein